MRGERRLRVFENRVLRRIFGPKRDEVIGEWRKLLSEMYCWGHVHMIQIEKNDMGGVRGTYVVEERCGQDFGGET
jgi:hypothetical protein